MNLVAMPCHWQLARDVVAGPLWSAIPMGFRKHNGAVQFFSSTSQNDGHRTATRWMLFDYPLRNGLPLPAFVRHKVGGRFAPEKKRRLIYVPDGVFDRVPQENRL